MTDQVKYTQKLKGSKTLITGGTSGIGFCVAEALLENGGTVIISSSNQDRVQQAVAKLQQSYPSAEARITGHACNLGDDETLEANLQALFDKTGGDLDHVIHTAGDPLAMKAISDIDIAFVKKAGAVRFFAPLLIGKLAPRYLRPTVNSSITITTGTVSDRPMPNWSVVNSYATGLQGMTRGLALDLKPIRVNLVSPGVVITELWKDLSEAMRKSILEQYPKTLPTGKAGTPEELAEAYLYLLKDTNVTGSMVSSNGGCLLV